MRVARGADRGCPTGPPFSLSTCALFLARAYHYCAVATYQRPPPFAQRTAFIHPIMAVFRLLITCLYLISATVAVEWTADNTGITGRIDHWYDGNIVRFMPISYFQKSSLANSHTSLIDKISFSHLIVLNIDN